MAGGDDGKEWKGEENVEIWNDRKSLTVYAVGNTAYGRGPSEYVNPIAPCTSSASLPTKFRALDKLA